MRIGYFADGPWAHRAFEKITSDGELQVVFVVLRYETQDEVLRQMSERLDIPVLVHRNINSDEFMDIVSEYKADLFVSMSFNQIFRDRIINLPALKTINCHAGKLPFYRGRNILNWALINDEKEFGITVHYLDEGIDTGDIILQDTYPITDEDDYNTLLNRAYVGCADVLYRAIRLIQGGIVKRIKQSDIDPVGMYCGGRQAGDEIIDWNQSSREIFNFIRALCDPGPRATTYLDGHEVRINRAEMIPGAHTYKNIAGQVVGRDEGGLIVKTGDTTIRITEYSGDAKIRIGSRLGDKK